MRHMNRHELESILQARCQELTNTLLRREDIQVERSADTMDELQNATMREQAVIRMDQESQLLREAREALDRLHNGSYGICPVCEEEIESRRLAAVPWARLCLRCQQEAEQRQQLGGSAEEPEDAELWMTAA